jgi:hypothetical protein
MSPVEPSALGGTRFDHDASLARTEEGHEIDHGESAMWNLEAAGDGLVNTGKSVFLATVLGVLGLPTLAWGGVAVGAVIGAGAVWDLGQAAYHGIMAGLGAGYQED